ncbi:hypothetical protein DSECCO2_509510 [anaerobic digester metagenome]
MTPPPEPGDPLATKDLRNRIEEAVRTACTERIDAEPEWLERVRMTADKGLEFLAERAVDSMVRALTNGLVSATIEELDGGALGSGSTQVRITPAAPVTIIDASKQPWCYYIEYVARAAGFEVATLRLTFLLVPRFRLVDAAFTRYPDGAFELNLGSARLECDIKYQPGPVASEKKGGPAPVLLGTIQQEFAFEEPFVIGGRPGTVPLDLDRPACPYGLDGSCPAVPR